MMEYDENIERRSGKLGAAIALAAEKFEGKYDKSGEPYILHCIQVMENTKKWDDVELQIAAVLHDIVEDTNVTIYDLKNIYGFSKRVCDIIADVTFPKNCTTKDYLSRILTVVCCNQDSIKVKMADLEHNSLILRMKGITKKDMERLMKYHKAYYILQAHLER